jgi:hypothetical protein
VDYDHRPERAVCDPAEGVRDLRKDQARRADADMVRALSRIAGTTLDLVALMLPCLFLVGLIDYLLWAWWVV